MKYILEYSQYNPTLIQKAKEFVENNYLKFPKLWNKELSDDENIQNMINYFVEFPDEMDSNLDLDRVNQPIKGYDFRGNAPILQKIGGVKDFKSF
jgi:hypothetical protein